MDESNITPTRRTVLKSSAAAAAVATGITGLTGTAAADSSGVYAPYVGEWTTDENLFDAAEELGIGRVYYGPAGDGTDDDEVNPGWLQECNEGACTDIPLEDRLGDIQAFQERGIEVGVMMGGWQGRVVSRDADSPEEIKEGYEEILDTLDISIIDIDDENADADGRRDSLNYERAQGLKMLKEERPDVTVGYTLAANRQGLNSWEGSHSPGEPWLAEVAEVGLDLDYVQLMVMHGEDPSRGLFEDAVENVADFMETQFTDKSRDEIYGMIGVVPRYVELDDASAQGLLDVAEEKGLYSIAPWMLSEDEGYQFSELFNQFGDGHSPPDDGDDDDEDDDDEEQPDVPAWDPDATYTSGDQVAHDGSIWEAQWWSRGDEPGSSEWGPWEEVDEVDDGDEDDEEDGDEDSDYPEWDAGTVYTGGERVVYQGDVWEAQWWTQGDEPGSSEWGPWEQIE